MAVTINGTPYTQIGGSSTMNAPAGIVAGEILIAYIAWGNASLTINAPPSGWTLAASGTDGHSPADPFVVYWKLATGSEPGSYTWGFTPSTPGSADGCIFRVGGAAASPIGATSTSFITPAQGSPWANPGLVTTAANSGVLFLWLTWFNAITAEAYTSPLTEVVAWDTVNFIALGNFAGIGATGAKNLSGTITGTVDPGLMAIEILAASGSASASASLSATASLAITRPFARDFVAASSQRIDLDTSLANWEFTQPFSISAWIYPKSATNGAIISHENNAGSRGWLFYSRGVSGSSRLIFEIVSSGAASASVQTTTVFPLNTWHHVVLTYTGSGTAAGMTIYVNGVSQPLSTIADTLAGGSILVALETQIGASGGASSPGFFIDARLARISIHNVVLTSGEIATLFGGAAMVTHGLQVWQELTQAGQDWTPDWSGAIPPHVGFTVNSPVQALGPSYTVLGPSAGTNAALTLAGPLVRNPGNPVLTNPGYPSGATGQPDDLQSGPSVVLKMGPSDYRMWFEGSRFGKDLDPANQPGPFDNDTACCYASSVDGTTWLRKQTAGVTDTIFNVNTLTTNPPGNTAAMKAWMHGESSPATVLFDAAAGLWKCWGHGGNNTGPRRMFYATSASADGLSGWVVQNNGLPVLQEGTGAQWDADSHGIADARVIRVSATSYLMLYVGGPAGGATGSIGLATSPDGLTWTKSASNPVLTIGAPGTWDSIVLFTGGFVFDTRLGLYVLWYGGQSSGNPDAIGYAYSTDAVTWTKAPFNPVLVGLGSSTLELLVASTIWAYLDGTTYRIIYRADDGVGGASAFRGRMEAAITISSSNPIAPFSTTATASLLASSGQRIFPIADTQVGNWTNQVGATTNLWQSINSEIDQWVNPVGFTNIDPQGVSNNPADFSNGNFGYPTILADPFIPGTLYLGTCNQGLWISADGGLSWSLRSTGSGSSAIFAGTLATLTMDVANGNMYASAQPNGGVLKSTDRGISWTQMFPGSNSIAVAIGTVDTHTISTDPFTPNHILASFHNAWLGVLGTGYIESLDGGVTWVQHNPPPGNTWGPGAGIWFGNNSNTWIVGIQQTSGGGTDGCWITTNAGANWTKFSALNVTGPQALYRDPATGILVLAASVGGLLRSTDGGATWANNDGSGSLGFVSLQAIASDGTNMYTLASFPTFGDNPPANQPWFTKPLLASDSAPWVSYGSTTVDPSGYHNGPVGATYDPYNRTIYTANWNGGVWKLAAQRDLVQSEVHPVSSVFIERLNTVSIPSAGLIKLSFLYQRTASDGQVDMTVDLMQGANILQTWLFPHVPDVWTQAQVVVTNSILNYTIPFDVRITANQSA